MLTFIPLCGHPPPHPAHGWGWEPRIPVVRPVQICPSSLGSDHCAPGALTPSFPISPRDKDAHRDSTLQAEGSPSLLCFICICVEDNHSSEGYSHHKSTMTLFSPSPSLYCFTLQLTINVRKNMKWRRNYSNLSTEIIGVDTCQQ